MITGWTPWKPSSSPIPTRITWAAGQKCLRVSLWTWFTGRAWTTTAIPSAGSSRIPRRGPAFRRPTGSGRYHAGGRGRDHLLGPVSYDEENPNNNSVAFRLDYGDTSFVFSGDAEWEEEHEILESGAELACDVLKLGHHGSSNASSYRFLRETNPEAVVISCGYDNSYGHPHRETLERIEDLGAALYRTDTQGTIAVFSDGEHLEFAQEPSVHSDGPAP